MKILKFSLPYRYKFIIFFVILIITTLFSFLGISVRSFEKDKTSYVYDYVLNTNQTKTGNLEAVIKDIKASVTLYVFNNKSVDVSEKIQFIALLKDEKIRFFKDEAKVQEPFLNFFQSRPQLKKDLPIQRSLLTSVPNIPQLYFLFFYVPYQKSYIVTGLTKSLVDELFENENGQFSFAHDGKNLLSSWEKSNKDFSALLNLSEGKVQRIRFDNDVFYAVANRSLILNQTVVTALRESNLFAFLKDSRTQNIALAALIIALSSIAGILFAKKLTNSINHLIGAANQVSHGDYDVKFEKVENGEIGVLQSTFMTMSQAVKHSLIRERDHQRLENDLKIAKLVRTFFPEYQFKNKFTDVACFYGPANECSGDWWGFFEIDHFQYYFMGDATGHGVSSALMTAKAYSLIHGFKNQMLSKEIDYLTPGKIMERLNQIFCSSNQVLMMTFFIMRLDTRTREMLYANASHEIPILVTANGEVKDIFESGSMPNPRLGHERDATFKNYSWKLNLHDIILLYTDGLTECSSPQGRYFGAKRTMMALKKLMHQDLDRIIEGLVEEIRTFSKSNTFEDDVGLMVIKTID